ncbi:hypothetical protein NCCP2222_19470 [Sporosarcina sp. NCCP-2222]|nr:hypothetical protein NCCP2222_19470 [Sporosarcina sp. NCCP-2222]
MKLHQLTCNNGHNFFLDLGLPLRIDLFVELAAKVTCPICQSNNVRLHAQEIEVTQ